MAKDLDSIEFGTDKSINQMIWEIMWDDYRRVSQVMTGVFLVLLLMLVITTFFVVFIVWYLIAVAIYVSYVKNKASGFFMRKFAEANGLEYERRVSLDTVSGKLFDVGRSRSIDYVVKGYFKDHPVRLFSYRFTIGSGKHSRTYHYTVWEIAFEKTEFPHILLRSKSMSKFARSQKGEEKINLGGEFSDKFQLYATRGYGTEVLQIFTPEVLRMLSNKGSNFSIEFAGKSMYIYDDVLVNDNDKLKEIYEVARGMFDSTGPLINRLHNDFEDMHRYYKE